MYKHMKVMLAANAIVLVIALVFSVVYVAQGWYRTSHVLDALLIILWVLVAAALVLAFRARARVHAEMRRRFYLSREWIYNHEIGYAPLAQIVPDGDPYEFVTFAGDALARMSYGLDVATAPDDFEPEYLISSRKFHFHLIHDDDDLGEAGVVIDQWAGTLQRIARESDGSHTYTEVGTYANAKELAILLDDADAMAPLTQDVEWLL